uniref:peptidylprolyl isomerase n=1 Tax=Romanomermis culicivorax TaxID=13658 RepID=A0A915JXG9_ROMCU
MQYLTLAALLIVAYIVDAKTPITKLQIGIKKRINDADCKIRSKNKDVLSVHYTGTLEDGTVFDSSRTRGDPFTFTLGQGQVIKGWDQGMLNMCEGEQRKLKIPSDLGYGKSGSPPKIPGKSFLDLSWPGKFENDVHVQADRNQVF